MDFFFNEIMLVGKVSSIVPRNPRQEMKRERERKREEKKKKGKWGEGEEGGGERENY